MVNGLPRVCLNGKPIFLPGVLDQGYFCDGIFLPAKEKDYEQDILAMKELNINLLRKHIKVEPECFYYYCDRHGMLVMQDMVNNGVYSWIKDTELPTLGIYQKGNGTLWGRKKRRIFFLNHMEDTLHHLKNHPASSPIQFLTKDWGNLKATPYTIWPTDWIHPGYMIPLPAGSPMKKALQQLGCRLKEALQKELEM
ncbi:MAG: hypothetical protein HFI76_03720 [Lachnospiraceae bacterium]|nr:hypothetical protein [Lachnospiraceae bacterium]